MIIIEDIKRWQDYQAAQKRREQEERRQKRELRKQRREDKCADIMHWVSFNRMYLHNNQLLRIVMNG